MTEMSTDTLNWHFTEPGNKRDRARFDSLDERAQYRVRRTAFRLYDGTRTVARCWAQALDDEERVNKCEACGRIYTTPQCDTPYLHNA